MARVMTYRLPDRLAKTRLNRHKRFRDIPAGMEIRAKSLLISFN